MLMERFSFGILALLPAASVPHSWVERLVMFESEAFIQMLALRQDLTIAAANIEQVLQDFLARKSPLQVKLPVEDVDEESLDTLAVEGCVCLLGNVPQDEIWEGYSGNTYSQMAPS